MVDRPEATACLIGLALATFRRMGSILNEDDRAQIRSEMAPAVAAIGEERFRALREDAESWAAEDGIRWALELVASSTGYRRTT